MHRYRSLCFALFLAPAACLAQLAPLHQVIDLKENETRSVRVPGRAQPVTIALKSVYTRTDPVRDAVRESRVRIEVDGKPFQIACANYQLPVAAGPVQIDCPVTGAYRANTNSDHWSLEADARLRIWPAGSPWVQPDSFGYPAKQRWFATHTQMSNEPTYADGGELPSVRKIYYHSGLDIGGAEALVEVVAATDGVVASRGTEVLPEFRQDSPVNERYDVVYLKDDRGWFYRYSHLYRIDSAIRPGAKVTRGQRIGLLGKEGGSGGWSHLHFEIKSRQPSGKWGTEEGYAFLWQAYQQEYGPVPIAVARPHHLIIAGQTAELDARLSRAPDAKITRYEWTFTDGSTATGSRVRRTYPTPGSFSEILQVTDEKGRISYDFAVVQVQASKSGPKPEDVPPTVHAVYYPTTGIRPGQLIVFKARTFRTTANEEIWDFGDGSPKQRTKSDGNAVKLALDGYAVITHKYDTPGDYIVRVERSNDRGETGMAHLWVRVQE